ncbi:hypothetical protein MASR1M90_23750 [Desulfovibrionales bacterium]
MFQKIRASFGRVCGATAGVMGMAGTALADNSALVTSSQTSIQSAAADALTVGGYVVAAVCSLLVIGLIMSIARKLR